MKSEQHGFCVGLNSINSTRDRSGSKTSSCHLPSLPISACFVAVRLPAMRFHDRLRLLHVRDAKRNVIHHSRESQIHVLGLVQHIFQPVGAVRNLHRHPIVRCARLIRAMPVKSETENVAIELVFGVAVIDHEIRCESCVAKPRNRP